MNNHTGIMNHKKVILSIAVLFIAVWFLFMREEPEQVKKPPRGSAKPLESYRAEFKRPDGSLPTDAQLEDALRAKGIPYHAASACQPGKVCAAKTKDANVLLPEIEFQNSGLSAQQKNEVRDTLADILSGQMVELLQVESNVKLGRIVVDTGKIVQLHFNKEFMTIAREEGRLTDFSESLNSAGMAALKGLNIYVDGRPLGEVMHEIDKKNNEEALAREQENQSTDATGTR